jgi:uncharacterized membrane protein
MAQTGVLLCSYRRYLTFFLKTGRIYLSYMEVFIMKKVVLFLLIFAVVGGVAFSFDIMSYPPPLAGGGKLMIDLGVGLHYGSSYGKMSIPPLFANIEYALPVGVPISVGGFFALYQYKYSWYSDSDYGWAYTFMTFGARGNWHWGFDVSWLDFYTGIWLGWSAVTSKWYGDNYVSSYRSSNYGGFDFGGQVGVHFYFTNNIGLVLEAGYPFLKAGLALKF